MRNLLYVFAAVALILTANACSGSASKQAESNAVDEVKSQVVHAMLAVKGSCGMCKTRIEKTAQAIEGVTVAEWSQEAQELHLHFDAAKTSREAISKALAAVGHDTELDKAPDEVYNALPGCCQYRK